MSKAGCYDSARIEVSDYLGLEEFAAGKARSGKGSFEAGFVAHIGKRHNSIGDGSAKIGVKYKG